MDFVPFSKKVETSGVPFSKQAEARHGILESILQDPSAKPRSLPLQELKEVTNNFSEDRQLGKGGFGIVYKVSEQGLLANGEAVAVKDLISSQFQFKENQFKHELDNLMKVQHENIVRFLGYCYESSREYMEYEATHVFAESSKMLLCFEYVPNGSLDKHINGMSHYIYTHHNS
ncbi:hypothetical protein PR202_gb13393 [Eleusine coracana subsp. coracana]|uniref:Protein kinase domain-containing protein n=1 Tax=Eleusine coracana subsp. coracana TaxID=191504 RepID=A0AAV5ESB5_ELECO|nr:hypothetical protein PR202_gb13393 [Eleusine coracana subsp. coracana]